MADELLGVGGRRSHEGRALARHYGYGGVGEAAAERAPVLGLLRLQTDRLIGRLQHVTHSGHLN